jgi:ferredoxin--NADP+ reductase
MPNTTPILSNTEIAPHIFEMVLHAPQVAAKAKAGQFAIAMSHAEGERIPLTLADWDAQKGTVTLVIMAIGTATKKLCALKGGEKLFAFAAPLGQASEVKLHNTVVMVAGGVGVAPIFPIAKAFHANGTRVISIHAARSGNLLFWDSMLQSVSHEFIVTTDDGSRGEKALATEPLKRLLQADTAKNIGAVYAIGPAPMMHACAEATRPFGTHTIVSLNTIMIDGTGMCGGCRVQVAGKPKFTCVDGPEFDAHQLEWPSILMRQKSYKREESCSLNRYISEQG